MKRCRCLVFVFLSFFAFFTAPQAAFPDDSEKDALLEKLLQARENWIQNASFCGHYTVRSGSFTSEEDAMTVGIPGSGRGHEYGFIAKLNGKCRRQRGFSEREDNTDPAGAEPIYFDTVANDRFCLHLERRADRGVLQKFSGEPGESLAVICVSGSPASFFSPYVYRFIESAAEGSDFGYAPLEDGRVLLAFAEDEQDHSRAVEKITVRTDMDRPAIEQIRQTFYAAESDSVPTMEIITKVLEWKERGGVLFPTRIRTATCSYKPVPEENVWETEEWVSDDIGERPPQEDDFTVRTERGDFILHLKGPQKERTIHIDELTEEDYDPSVWGSGLKFWPPAANWDTRPLDWR